MRTTLRVIAGSIALGAVALVSAPSASANSIPWTKYGVGMRYAYNDGADSFCLDSVIGGRYIKATLTPVVAGRGPSKTYVQRDGSWFCWGDLARAYEDTQYTLRLEGTGGKPKTLTFFS